MAAGSLIHGGVTNQSVLWRDETVRFGKGRARWIRLYRRRDAKLMPFNGATGWGFSIRQVERVLGGHALVCDTSSTPIAPVRRQMRMGACVTPVAPAAPLIAGLGFWGSTAIQADRGSKRDP
jgi:hypothetical protein